MTAIEPLDFSGSRPSATSIVPLSDTVQLDADEVSRYMLEISDELTVPVRMFLEDEKEENWFNLLDWVVDNSEGDANRRYAMLETVGVLVWGLTKSAGVTIDKFPDLAQSLDDDTIPEEERLGMHDAVSLIFSEEDPLDGLGDEWLPYASEDFSEERYLSAVGFWLFLLCGFMRETAGVAGMKPEALWDIMSEDEAE